MDNKAELIEQLTSIRELIWEKSERERKLENNKREINKLTQETEKGVAYHCWYATDNEEKVNTQINAELKQAQYKVSSRKRMVLSIIFSSVAALFLVYLGAILMEAVSEALGVTVLLAGLVVMGLAFPVFVLPAIKARRKAINAAGEMSAEQRNRIVEAARIDEYNKQQNIKKKVQLEEELRRRNHLRIAELTKENKEITKETAKVCTELRKYTILSSSDQDWLTVHNLIKILQSNRANTLQEAFRIYDEQKHRERMTDLQEEANRQARAAQNRILEQMKENEAHRQEEAELLRQDMLRRQQAEEEHNREMERLAQKQIDELEKKRQEDRDYRRSGYIKGGG